jgi:uncharacterized protein (TIGR02246 family)
MSDVDRARIEQLVVDYARAVDGRDAEAVAALFTEDGRMIVHPGGRPATEHEGRVAIAAVISSMRYRMTKHRIVAHTSSVDGATATASSRCIAHHLSGPTERPVDRVVAAHYEDELVAHASGWSFAVRRVHLDDEVRLELVDLGLVDLALAPTVGTAAAPTWTAVEHAAWPDGVSHAGE